MEIITRSLVAELPSAPTANEQPVVVRGWVHRMRELRTSTFVVVKDCSGSVQCVAAPDVVKAAAIKLDDAVEVRGRLRSDARSQQGYELHVESIAVLGSAANDLPFTSSARDLAAVGAEVLLDHRPLALRHESVNTVFRVQAALLESFRAFLRTHRFTEIVTSKIVASGTEGGTNLFELKYFDRIAYLAQSPQFFKEQCVAGLERVFETGHVYRAEPHATSRHLTEYCSLDLELGFIDGPEDIIQLERELLTFMFEAVTRTFGVALPSMLAVPTWTFADCVQRIGRAELLDHDLDSEAERALCALAEEETGVPAVFVLGYPAQARPFYTMPGCGFDLLFRGMEITSGGQRLHTRASLEAALQARRVSSTSFESHLRMFELGMPPHGGLAIGLERLTALVLGLGNVREATLYPRDRGRVTP